jgi:cobalt/nickel transport system permease protein
MFILTLIALIWAWKGTKKTLSRSFPPIIAICSSIILIAQMIEFPVAGGASTWHVMGGTFVSMILGPHATIISMTIVLLIQTSLLGEGGISAFGANAFNMAVISGLSFYIVKFLSGSSFSIKRFTTGLFIATWMSSILTALATGIELGVYPMVAPIGSMAVTLPTMLFFYVPSGLVEAAITVPLVLSLLKIMPRTLKGLQNIKNQ